jgi:hypothetical protein
MRQRIVQRRAKRRETPQVVKADGEGFDADSVTSCIANSLSQSQDSGEAESEAVSGDSGLRAVVDAWPALPAAIKAGILAMIRAAN